MVVRQVRELVMMDNQFGVSSPGLDILSYSDSVTYVNILCNRQGELEGGRNYFSH